jgi:hypothetical protein
VGHAADDVALEEDVCDEHRLLSRGRPSKNFFTPRPNPDIEPDRLRVLLPPVSWNVIRLASRPSA